MIITAARALAGAALLTSITTLPHAHLVAPADRAAQPPPCPVADDDKYAYTREVPVQVGGSPVYGAARQRRYLDALRGPEGQRVQYKRRGAEKGPDGTILDAYEVTYEGLEKPVTLFLDWYHYNPQKAPRGFTCGQPVGLGPPPVNPFQEMDDVRAVALAQGATREFAPIPLGADGSTTHGVVYDRFRLLARAARMASASGTPLDPQRLPRQLAEGASVILAYPLACDARTVRPAAIDIVAANGTAMPASSRVPLDEDSLAALLPGVQVPAGSLAVRVSMLAPRANDTVRITYAEAACGGTGDQVALPIKFSPARGIDMPAPPLPAGAAPAEAVLLQALVDLDGAFQRAAYVGGPAGLARAATEAVGRWRSEPARSNGAPVAAGVLVQVRFIDSK